MYRAITHGIQVTVEPRFLEAESDPENGRFVWAYTVEILNLGVDTVQLRSRHWLITDATGQTEEVRGPGVIGEQPVLQPGESFTYTSGAPLTTPSGVMRGSYAMVTDKDAAIEVEIPAFPLDSPHAKRTLH
jgi:ApaG protein